MAGEVHRVFVDTSALIAGFVSSKGAAREVLRLGEARIIQLVVSEWVVVELDRVISEKFPGHVQDLRHTLKKVSLEVVADPPPAQVRRYKDIIEEGDAPILAAAVEACVDSFVTWDKRDFQSEKVRARVDFPIMTPGEFLTLFRSWYSGQGG